jgi:hypothetical protein
VPDQCPNDGEEEEEEAPAARPHTPSARRLKFAKANGDADDRRTPAEALADKIIELVHARANSLGGKRGDAAGQVMHGAFVYGFRRFVAIRHLAGRREGAEALILARSLISIVAGATYVDGPEDLEERRRRYEQYRVSDVRERLKMVTDLLETGFDIPDSRDRCT